MLNLGAKNTFTVGFKYKGPKVFGDFDQKSLVPGNFFNTLF